ncbi:hypothetical protein FHS82_000577 [Pseudochelatococcus lubricantis]|uniref:Uncharacterized protein n=1 Tax=Pseudochelatococcus lubricantis TaxID=1538102 RepID=A0ABX0UUY0_9HYPH|nr:hypothetical protein [Pseudochelatococcus lubricantis]NIJ56764.1 hypothetical protein [Pseudochelatococcus lubricantis]
MSMLPVPSTAALPPVIPTLVYEGAQGPGGMAGLTFRPPVHAAGGILDAANGGRELQGRAIRRSPYEEDLVKIEQDCERIGQDYKQLGKLIETQFASATALLRRFDNVRTTEVSTQTAAGKVPERQQVRPVTRDVCTQTDAAEVRAPGEGADVHALSGPAYKSLFNWNECRGRHGEMLSGNAESLRGAFILKEGPLYPLFVNGHELTPRTLARLLEGAKNLDEVAERLEAQFRKVRLETIGPDREKLVLISGTPIAIKFGSGNELARYDVGLAYRRLLNNYQLSCGNMEPDEVGKIDRIMAFIDSIKSGPLRQKMRILYNKYTDKNIAESLKAYLKYGPSDEMNAYSTGAYLDAAGMLNRFVILKNPSYDNRGQKVSGDAVNLMVGHVLASRIEAQVNGSDNKCIENAQAVGKIAGIEVRVENDGAARTLGSSVLHVVPMPQPAAENDPGAETYTKSIMKAHLSRLSDSQLSYLHDSILACINTLDTTNDVFVGSGYRIVFPTNKDDMPTMAHVNVTRWMPAKPPANLSEADARNYQLHHAEAATGQIMGLCDMLHFVDDALKSRAQ